MEYSIVIPAFNESDKIISTLNQVLDFMRGFSKSFEILLVDDGSADNTVTIVEEYSKTNSEIRILKMPHRGKGPTVSTGVMEAQGELIYMCDADLASPIDELKKLTVWVKDHEYDIVIASREGTGAVRVNEPIYRHLLGRGFNFLVQVTVLPGIKDSQCGFKLFKGAVAKEIFSKMLVYKTSNVPGEQDGTAVESLVDNSTISRPYLGAFDVEFLYIARLRGYKIKELPVYWKYVKTTRLSPFIDSVKMGADVLKIFINGMKGAYK